MINLGKDETLEYLDVGGYCIIQNSNGYCFTSDAIKLANYVKATKKSKVLELCAGSGVIGTIVHGNFGCSIDMVELQPQMAELCSRSVQYNNLQHALCVHNINLLDAPKTLIPGSYDVVVCNPPYEVVNAKSEISENPQIAICRHELQVNFEQIAKVTSTMLKYGGYCYFVHKTQRLADVISTLNKFGLQPKEVVLCKDYLNTTFLIKAKKGGKVGLTLTAK